jgi:hypothetical protein
MSPKLMLMITQFEDSKSILLRKTLGRLRDKEHCHAKRRSEADGEDETAAYAVATRHVYDDIRVGGAYDCHTTWFPLCIHTKNAFAAVISWISPVLKTNR